MFKHMNRREAGRRGGGIEPLHVSMPHELKSCPSTSPTHPGCLGNIYEKQISKAQVSKEKGKSARARFREELKQMVWFSTQPWHILGERVLESHIGCNR